MRQQVSQSVRRPVVVVVSQSLRQAEEGRVIDRGCVEGKARKDGRTWTKRRISKSGKRDGRGPGKRLNYSCGVLGQGMAIRPLLCLVRQRTTHHPGDQEVLGVQEVRVVGPRRSDQNMVLSKSDKKESASAATIAVCANTER